MNRQQRRAFEKALAETVDEMMNDGQLRRADYSDEEWKEMRRQLSETVRQQIVDGPGDDIFTLNVNNREFAAILAGLRRLQQEIEEDPDHPPLPGIMTNEGEFPALNADEIDALCVRLNTTG